MLRVLEPNDLKTKLVKLHASHICRESVIFSLTIEVSIENTHRLYPIFDCSMAKSE